MKRTKFRHHTQYIDGWRTKVIDLKKELEARLDAEAIKEQHES